MKRDRLVDLECVDRRARKDQEEYKDHPDRLDCRDCQDHQVVRENQVTKVQRDHQVYQALQVKVEPLAAKEVKVFLVSLVQRDLKDRRVTVDRQEHLDPVERMEIEVKEGLLGLRAKKEKPELEDHQVFVDQQEAKVRRDRQDLLVFLDRLVNLEHLVEKESLVSYSPKYNSRAINFVREFIFIFYFQGRMERMERRANQDLRVQKVPKERQDYLAAQESQELKDQLVLKEM